MRTHQSHDRQPVANAEPCFYILDDAVTRFAHRADGVAWANTEAPVREFAAVARGPWLSWVAGPRSVAPVAADVVVEILGTEPDESAVGVAGEFIWSDDIDPEGLITAYRVWSPSVAVA